ncbi:hypothetical protein DUI87_12999 [Hirundo rustica rustica]|uniref:Uncharacterized protein n=1 Tax=Hirundo rustica rustica TaxID=333673 RepID=A0A3M0KAP8_HIRRU|nr:hypothetical protein DUI87_12999 [Hirundo rustica rustica]
MTKPQEPVAELIRKARTRIRELSGCDFECIHIPIEQHALPVLSAGANPGGLNSCEEWQVDMTHIMSFGRKRASLLLRESTAPPSFVFAKFCKFAQYPFLSCIHVIYEAVEEHKAKDAALQNPISGKIRQINSDHLFKCSKENASVIPSAQQKSLGSKYSQKKGSKKHLWVKNF